MYECYTMPMLSNKIYFYEYIIIVFKLLLLLLSSLLVTMVCEQLYGK